MAPPPPVALVTGGARRIGRAIVEDLAAHGWAVAIHYNRSEEDAARFADAVRAAGGSAAIIHGEFADLDAVAAIVDRAADALGTPTLLVNNASMFEKDTVGHLDPGLWQRQMTVNLAAPVFLAEAFAKRLPSDADGNVVNVLDQRIWRPTPRYFSYQISKSALFAATVTLAQALAPRVRVNGIAPGPTLPNPTQTEERFRRQASRILLRRGPELAEFGRTIRYFVENRSITGQVIALDGGEHITWVASDRPPPAD